MYNTVAGIPILAFTAYALVLTVSYKAKVGTPSFDCTPDCNILTTVSTIYELNLTTNTITNIDINILAIVVIHIFNASLADAFLEAIELTIALIAEIIPSIRVTPIDISTIR